jgi:hypothetical protein
MPLVRLDCHLHLALKALHLLGGDLPEPNRPNRNHHE